VTKAGETPPKDPDFEEPSPGWSVEPLEIDVAEAVDLGPRLGRYAAYVLAGAEASNVRVFALFPDAESEAEPETAESLRQLREAGGPLLPLQLRKPVELIHGSAPEAGPQPIWKLSQGMDKEGRLRLQLEYRLEGLPRFLYPGDRPHLDETGQRVHAQLPVMLLAFDGKRSLILRKALGLPVMTPPSGGPSRPILSGRVSMDLLRLLGRSVLPERLSIWALTLDQRALLGIDSAPAAG
jgi:hypothetical protein